MSPSWLAGKASAARTAHGCPGIHTLRANGGAPPSRHGVFRVNERLSGVLASLQGQCESEKVAKKKILLLQTGRDAGKSRSGQRTAAAACQEKHTHPACRNTCALAVRETLKIASVRSDIPALFQAGRGAAKPRERPSSGEQPQDSDSLRDVAGKRNETAEELPSLSRTFTSLRSGQPEFTFLSFLGNKLFFFWHRRKLSVLMQVSDTS